MSTSGVTFSRRVGHGPYDGHARPAVEACRPLEVDAGRHEGDAAVNVLGF